MENLSQEQQESLRKASNERLRVMAGRLGSVSDDGYGPTRFAATRSYSCAFLNANVP